jgi:1-acyl-sn-glycerol-3-phosphate acyltransferase
MYPPIFRDRAKAAWNDDALDRLKRFLGERGTIVGMHPEGTRNKTDDPYTLLPAQPGVGQIVLHAKPIVVPMFIHGHGNDFIGAITTSWKREAHVREPIIMTFGEPMDYSEFLAKKPRVALYKQVADKINAAIAALGDRERELRAQITGRELNGDPRWLWPR